MIISTNADVGNADKAAYDALEAGDLATAETQCRRALAEFGDSQNRLCLLAEILERQNRPGEALTALEGALAFAPDDAVRLYQVGRMLIAWEDAEVAAGEVYEPFQLNFPWGGFPFPARDHFPQRKRPRAMDMLRRSIAADGDHGGALALLGLQLVMDPGGMAEAVDIIRRAASRSPELADTHLGVAIMGARQGEFQLTAAAANAVLEHRPDDFRPVSLKVLVEGLTGDGGDIGQRLDDLTPNQSVFLAEIMILIDEPGSSAAPAAPLDILKAATAAALSAHAQQAITGAGAFVGGARFLSYACRLAPELPCASVAAAELLYACAAFELARSATDYVLQVAPDDAAALRLDARLSLQGGHLGGASADDIIELAETHAAQSEFATAEELLRHAARRSGPDTRIVRKLAQVVGLQGRLSEVTEILEDALKAVPGDAETEGDLANAYLAAGRTGDAWPLYESRLKRPRGSTPRTPPPLPVWQGQDLGDKALLVWREEGIGDEIRFSTCLPDLMKEAHGSVVYECSPRLLALYQRSFPIADVRAEDMDRTDFGAFGYHLPAGSMPMRYRPSLEAFPEDGSFLIADPERVARWRGVIEALGRGPKIGIGWRSLNTGWHKLPLHSALTDWGPIFDVPGLVFINLQCQPRQGEIATAVEKLGAPVHEMDGLDLTNDMEEVAALISALDAVVSCQCWLLHLAGALGTKVYSFNGLPNPYTMGLSYNPWAPNSEIFYKRPSADWSGPMQAIAERLQTLTPHGR